MRGIERTPPSVLLDGVAQAPGLGVAGAEHDPQDDLERQLAHPLERDDAAVPAGELAPRELRHDRTEGAHPVAVKRRRHQPSLAQVGLAVEQQDRMRSGERAQELPALARGRDRWVEAEHFADRVGIGEQDHRLLGPVGPDRDRVAVAAVQPLHERAGARHPADRLPGGGSARTGRQIHVIDRTGRVCAGVRTGRDGRRLALRAC